MGNYTSLTDEELILRLREGDEDVTDYLLEKYKPLVRKKANTMFLIGGETDDLIQEGMIGLFKAVRDYKDDKETSFYHFAELCINRQIYSALEASNRKKHLPLNSYVSFESSLEENFSDESISPEQLIIEQEIQEEFFARLQSQLSEMENEVLSFYLEGLNYIQIADKLEREPKSIDNALQRIRQKTKALERR